MARLEKIILENRMPPAPLAPAATIRSRAPNRLLGLQVGRGLAALMVVIFHAGRSLALPQYVGTNPFGGLFVFGHAGVDFFFVLSGFIITHVHYADLGRPDRLKRYIWRRFTRIFPIYWAVSAIYFVLGTMAPNAAQRLGALNLLESLTLLPIGQVPLVGVAWSLEHEVFFYFAFGLAIWSRKLGWLAILIGLAPLVAQFFPPSASIVSGFLLTGFHVQFLMGILAARLAATGAIRFPLVVIGVGLALFTGTAVMEVYGVISINQLKMACLYGGSSTMIIAGIVAAEQSGRIRLGATAELFGAISYVLYLVHPMVVGLTARAFAIAGLLGSLPGWSVLIVQVLAAITVAMVIHQRVELPISRWLRRFERTSVG